MKSGEDWENNLLQGVGAPSDYYDRALKVGEKLARATDGEGGFTTIGHSLGGGMAGAVSAKYGVPGDTFNAAGVSELTLGRVGGQRSSGANLINAYRVDGEALTSLQNWNRRTLCAPDGSGPAWRDWLDDRILPTAVGRVRTLASADGASWLGSMSPVRPVNLHSIDSVIDSFEQEKASDSGLLQRETSGRGLFSR